MSKHSPYYGDSIVLTTKHAKSIAIAPSFKNVLSAQVIESQIDTDQLGTFSGEIERKSTALDCARIKCELGLDATQSLYGVASEGSFGPHPYIPFLPSNNEILYFIDRKRNFHLHISSLSTKTNYNMQALDSMDQLEKFCKKALFPSHALIIRPDTNENKNHIFKGINTQQMLNEAFNNAMKESEQGKVWVETDMRAHMNPSRMLVIQELAHELAKRLSVVCLQCNNPGWGKVGIERGLACGWCGLATELVAREIYGCVSCDHKENIIPLYAQGKADPGNCSHCNP